MPIFTLLLVILGVLIIFTLLYIALAPSDWRLKKRLTRYAQTATEKEQNSGQKQASLLTSNKGKSDAFFRALGGDPTSLKSRLMQTGTGTTIAEYLIYQALLAIIGAALMIVVLHKGILMGLGVGIVMGYFLPKMWLKSKINKRIAAFNKVFPDAIDTMVRTLKSGLPVGEAMGIIGETSESPVKEEFQRIKNNMSFGMTLSEAVTKAVERMPTQEFSFFAISLSIQSETGGNLSETLGNLGGVLRDRQALLRLVKSKASEAKIQAKVLGALPCLVMGGMYLAAPTYIGLMVKDPLGQTVGIGTLIWMFIGFYIMHTLTKVDY